MDILTKAEVACALINAKLFRIRKPVIVNWAITYRCNRSCKYCGVGDSRLPELNTPQILALIDEMSELGTRKIHFTGGEPLLKEDIYLIIKYCKEKGISAGLNSNGSLVPKKIESLKNLDLLSLSLDGDEETHDSVRGAGSYREVTEAIKSAKKKNIKLRLITVLSKVNLHAIEFILSKAKELKSVVVFQPATRLLLESDRVNSIAPSVYEYRQVISKLIEAKRSNRYIGNSLSGLRHLYNWPEPRAFSCVNALIVCRIEPDGSLYGCGDFKQKINAINCQDMGFQKAFNSLVPLNCKECWCASYVELNSLFSMKLDSIFNIKKFI